MEIWDTLFRYKLRERLSLRQTPAHIAATFKRHLPSPPLNVDAYCCHLPQPSPQFVCFVSLCPRRLAFVLRRRHWKTPPPSNAPTHRPVLHHAVTHSQLHSTSEYVGMMWGFLKRNPTRCRTTAAQSTRSSSGYAMRIQPPVSKQSNRRPLRWGPAGGGGPSHPLRSLLGSR